MYLTNNHNSEQNYFYCRNNCGVKITFSNDVISKNGKLIPIQENGLHHNCPNSPYNKATAIVVEKRAINKLEERQIIDNLKVHVTATSNRLQNYELDLVVREKED
jgi:hypothetical protein